MTNKMKAPLTALLAFVLSTASFHTLEAYAGFGTQDYLNAKRAKGQGPRSGHGVRYAPYPAAGHGHPGGILGAHAAAAAAGGLRQEGAHHIVPYGGLATPPRRPHHATGAPTPERGATSSVNTRPRAQRALTFGGAAHPALDHPDLAALRAQHEEALDQQRATHAQAMQDFEASSGAYIAEIIHTYREEMEGLNAYIQKLEHEKEEQTRGRVISEDKLRTYDQKLEELQAAYKKRLENANAREKVLIKKHLLTNKEKQKLDESNGEMKAELAASTEALASLINEHRTLLAEHEAVLKERNKFAKWGHENDQALQEAQKEIATLTGEKEELKASEREKISRLKAEVDDMRDEKERVSALEQQENEKLREGHAHDDKETAAKIADLEAKLEQQTRLTKTTYSEIEEKLKQEEERRKEVEEKNKQWKKEHSEMRATRDAALSNADEVEDAVGSRLDHLEERAGKAHAKAQEMMKKSAHNA